MGFLWFVGGVALGILVQRRYGDTIDEIIQSFRKEDD